MLPLLGNCLSSVCVWRPFIVGWEDSGFVSIMAHMEQCFSLGDRWGCSNCSIVSDKHRYLAPGCESQGLTEGDYHQLCFCYFSAEMSTVELIFLWLQLPETFRSRLLKIPKSIPFSPGLSDQVCISLWPFFSPHTLVSCLRRTHYRPGILFPHEPGAVEACPALGQHHAHANAGGAPPGTAHHRHTRYTNDTLHNRCPP